MYSKFIRALIAAFLLAGAVCFAAEYEFGITMLEDAQAFLVSEKITYTNTTGGHIENVMFSVYANCFRRESTLPYDNESLEAAFPYGYAPSGIEFSSVTVNGERANWAVSGESECFLRVNYPLDDGESAVIRFDYTLLVSSNRAFLGMGTYEFRLEMFYPAVCAYGEDGFILNAPSRAGEWFVSELSDFSIAIAVPDGYDIACAGTTEKRGDVYSIKLENADEATLVISRAFHRKDGERVTVFGSERSLINSIAKRADAAIAAYERLIGEFPYERLVIAVADTENTRVSPGFITLNEKDADDIAFYVAQEYFGCAVITDPATDPFLRTGLSKYVSLLMLSEKEFSTALTKQLLPSISITVPGGLTPDSRLIRFSSEKEFETVVTLRGAAVLHEMRNSFGAQTFENALKIYYQNGKNRLVTFRDFVSAFDAAADRSTGEALVAWLYSISEYAVAGLEFYD